MTGQPRHFIDTQDFSREELLRIIDLIRLLKEADRDGACPQLLAGASLGMIFEEPSTRTRVSFEVAMTKLGGHALYLKPGEIHLGARESIGDTARVISRMVDVIEARTLKHQTVLDLAANAAVPVINGLTNRTHPCQIMADVMTYEEHRGPIAGKKVVWCGDGNNVCASFLHAAGQFGFDFTFTGPETLDPEDKFVAFAREKGSKITIQRDPFTAVEGADLVVTDTWVSMHDPESAKERRHNQLRPYQVNEQLMSRAKPDSLFMHCLPAHRNDEATSAVMDGPHSVIFDEAENRLHAQKAIMRWCLGV